MYRLAQRLRRALVMSRIAQPGVNPNAGQQVAQQVQRANAPLRDRVQQRPDPGRTNSGATASSSSSTEAKSSLETSAHVAIQPNRPREDAGQHGGRQGGGGQGGAATQDAHNVPTLNRGDASMAKAAVQLSLPTASSLLSGGRDSVLLNVGGGGFHTFATGSLIPRKFARHYQKHTLGRYRDPWEEADPEELERGRAPTPEEYEAIVAEMTAVRVNERRSALLAMSRLPKRRAG